MKTRMKEQFFKLASWGKKLTARKKSLKLATLKNAVC